MAKYKAGDAWLPSASWLTRVEEVIDWYFRNKARGDARDRSGGDADSNFCKVQNDSGDNRRAGEILEFTDFALADPQVLKAPSVVMIGGAVAMANGYGVISHPLLASTDDVKRIGDCQVFGCAVALVNIIDTDHKYASPKKDEYVLQSCPAGPVRILYQPPGDPGEKPCAVFITQDPTGFVKPVSTISKGDSGDCQVWLNGEDTGAIVNLFALLGDCTGGLYATQFGGYVFPGEC